MHGLVGSWLARRDIYTPSIGRMSFVPEWELIQWSKIKHFVQNDTALGKDSVWTEAVFAGWDRHNPALPDHGWVSGTMYWRRIVCAWRWFHSCSLRCCGCPWFPHHSYRAIAWADQGLDEEQIPDAWARESLLQSQHEHWMQFGTLHNWHPTVALHVMIFVTFQTIVSSPVAMPMARKRRNTQPNEEAYIMAIYCLMIKRLMDSMTVIQPVITYAIGVISQSKCTPSNPHMVALMPIYWYWYSKTYCQLLFGMTLGVAGNSIAQCYVYLDWAGYLDNYNLTSGSVITCSEAVDCRSRNRCWLPSPQWMANVMPLA